MTASNGSKRFPIVGAQAPMKGNVMSIRSGARTRKTFDKAELQRASACYRKQLKLGADGTYEGAVKEFDADLFDTDQKRAEQRFDGAMNKLILAEEIRAKEENREPRRFKSLKSTSPDGRGRRGLDINSITDLVTDDLFDDDDADDTDSAPTAK